MKVEAAGKLEGLPAFLCLILVGLLMLSQIFQFLASGVRSGLRGKTVQATFVLGLVLVSFAYLAAGFSPRQPRTIALDIGFSVIRLTLVLLALFWVQELLTKEMDKKTILHSLALPVSRSSYLIGRYLAIVVLIVVSTTILGWCLLLAVYLSGAHYEQEFAVSLGAPYWIALVGVALDVSVVAAFATAIAIVSTVPVMPLALGAAFAVAGRALGASIDYLARGADGDLEFTASVGPYVDLVRWVIPDLSRLDWREWSLYGSAPSFQSMSWSIVMAVSYAVIALALGARALKSREFS